MFYEATLPNGIRVIGQKLPHFRSVSIGVWVGTGSVKERQGEGGISHYIEHMLFKGTQKRSAQAIAAEMDGIGAQLNAFTSKECTCFYARAMDEHLDRAVDILSDMVLHSVFDPAEMEKEKGVVCEEILMVEDTPEDVVMELLSSAYFGDSPLGRPILGTEESVRSMSREMVTGYLARHYNAGNILVAAAGNFEEQALYDILCKYFCEAGTTSAPEPYPAIHLPQGHRFVSREKPIEQCHITLATPAYCAQDPRYYPLLVLNNALGGNLSSRLFQKIREERGLAYSVYSFNSSYRELGTLGFYAGTNAAQAQTVLALMIEEMDQVRANGLEEEEFVRSKEQLKGSYVLSNESVGSRMTAIGKRKLLYGETKTEEEILQSIEQVTMEDVRAAAKEVLSTQQLAAAFVGKVSGLEAELERLLS